MSGTVMRRLAAILLSLLAIVTPILAWVCAPEWLKDSANGSGEFAFFATTFMLLLASASGAICCLFWDTPGF
jgi:formate hydrogenlyase subunit 3/multisubunit Na+/H+ antiporter MnhD subunit